jgi:hypothetical protein
MSKRGHDVPDSTSAADPPAKKIEVGAVTGMP